MTGRVGFIAIEGPIGAGKTSLAKTLAQRLNARLELEDIESNPFLKDFYRDPGRFAFKTQIFFLLSRYQRQRELLQGDLFKKGLISDYLFAKDRIFAEINLDDRELALYDRIYEVLNPTVAKPDLAIYLRAETEALISRVRGRGLDFERGITGDYLERVNQAYGRFFSQYNETPLLVVDSDKADFIGNRQELERLVEEIDKVKEGTHHYMPLGSKSLD